MSQLAKRTDAIMPFYAVEMFKQAAALSAEGRDIISLGIGEPDFTAPTQVVETLNRAADAGLSGYTSPAGLPLCAKPLPITIRRNMARRWIHRASSSQRGPRVRLCWRL